jgi:hypothetical protein
MSTPRLAAICLYLIFKCFCLIIGKKPKIHLSLFTLSSQDIIPINDRNISSLSRFSFSVSTQLLPLSSNDFCNDDNNFNFVLKLLKSFLLIISFAAINHLEALSFDLTFLLKEVVAAKEDDDDDEEVVLGLFLFFDI